MQGVHKNVVSSHAAPLFHPFNLLISVFIPSSFSFLYFPPSLSIEFSEEEKTEGGREEGEGMRARAGGAFENSSSIAAVLW